MDSPLDMDMDTTDVHLYMDVHVRVHARVVFIKCTCSVAKRPEEGNRDG